MKVIFRLAKLELGLLFYSPIAWFLSVVFIFQCGLVYTSVLQDILTNQNLGGAYLQSLHFLTSKVLGSFGMFAYMSSKIYLYLPLLTMGLISREVSTGTIKLLFSSPVTVSQIILGKFMAMVFYNLLLIFILLFFCIFGVVNIQSADIGLIFSGLLGIFLLSCTYAAIGLFMSCLTSYQVVAALSTLVVFGALSYIGTVWQGVDFVRDLTYFLSISGRSDYMIFGLITSKDLLYFLIIICVFLSFSIVKLQTERASTSKVFVYGQYLLIFFFALFLGNISSLTSRTIEYDSTANKTQTLTVNTQKIVKELGDEPVEVVSYINLLDQHYYLGEPEERNTDLVRWGPYLRFKPNIKLTYVYYYDEPMGKYVNLFAQYPGKSLKQIAQNYADSYKVDLNDYKTPEEIKKIIDLRPEQNRYVMQLRYKGRSTFLRLYDDPEVFPSETEISAALKRLMVKLPKIAFLTGEFERNKNKSDDRDYSSLTSSITFRYSLVNQGFDTDTISLKNNEIPRDITTLVIADPRVDFDPVVKRKIQQYINDGGNILIAGEPGKQTVINPLIEQLGVQMTDGILVEKSKNFPPNMVRPFLTGSAAALSKILGQIYKDSIGVSTPGVAGLSFHKVGGFAIIPLLVTNPKVSWNKKGKLILDSATVNYSPSDGDEKKSFPVALALTRKINGKQQRIIISGDADFLSNIELGRGQAANFRFGTQLFGWFTYGQFPIDTSRPDSKDNRLNLTSKGLAELKILFLGIVPGFVLIFSAIVLIRRKRK